jgi:formylglycine-generating enzyme required for sulfatase activity
MKQAIDKYDLLAEFIREREEAGHVFGVDEHLQIQELLRLLPGDLPPEALRHYFVPLLAADAQQQEEFHAIFKKSLANLLAKRDPLETPAAPPAPAPLRRWRIVAALAALLLAALLAWVFWPKPPVEDTTPPTSEQSGPLYFPFQVETGQTHTECPDSARLGSFGPVARVKLCDVWASYNRYERFSYDKNGCLTYIAPDTAGRDSICLLFTNTKGESRKAIFLPTIIPIDTAVVTKLEPLQLPYPHDLRPYIVPPASDWALFMQQWGWLLRAAAFLLWGLLLFAFAQVREQRRRKLVAQMESGKPPPYIWEIRVEGEEIEVNEQFFLALQHMRRREAGDSVQLDLPATVGATIKNAGLAGFRYRRLTRPPEYLLLIDRSSASNHRARLYDWLYQAFRDNEVLAERFYYNGDLRRFWNESHPGGWSLPELAHRYSQSRLLVMGSGYSLLSSNTGQLAKWAAPVFQQWKQRALLSPQPVQSWGLRERNLAGLFTVLPASLQGLNLTINQFEALEEGAPPGWRETIKDAAREPIELKGGLMETLNSYFPEPLVRWIAICAVYPHLHWDLTLFLGRLLSTEDRNLLTVDNLLKLTRLSWFVDGKMPVAVRAVLLDFLEREHPALLAQVREALHGLLQRQELPKESVAYSELRLQMALNEWLFTKDKARKKALEKEIAQELEKGAEIDLPMVRYLEGQPGPLDFLVPDSWKKYLRPGGHRRLGLRRVGKELLYLALPLWLLGGAAALFWPGPTPPQCGRSVQAELDGKVETICLDDPEATLLWQERLAFYALDSSYVYDSSRHDRIDSLFAAMQPLPLRQEIAANIATAYYNQGVPHYNRAIAAQGQQTARDSACFYFGRAEVFDSTIAAVQNALRWCASPGKPIPKPLAIRYRYVPGDRYKVDVELSGGTPPYRLEFRNPAGAVVWDRSASYGRSITVFLDAYREAPGKYRLIASDSLGARAEALVAVDPVVVAPVAVKGQVRGQDGAPLAGVQVRWNGQDTGIKTAPDGRFEIARAFQPNADSLSFLLAGYAARTLSVAAVQAQPEVVLEEIPPPPPAFEPEMVFVPGGQFEMGCTAEQGSDCYDDEKPPHKVTLSDFWIGKYEVTQAQWRAVMGEYPPELYNKGCDQCPVERVSWDDIQEFLKTLNEKTGKNYRLPTEAEWEYAARGGKNSQQFKYAGSNNLDEVGWYTNNSNSNTNPVGQKKPNALGIFDMSGNVWEWCADWYGDYSSEAQANPKGPAGGSNRVGRGGGWNYYPQDCRVSNRNHGDPAGRGYFIGFRLARSL